ncbi:DUF3887 domain-containing protein [Romboutsia sp.]|uniref:DUF3887 domain-containing protein n=1 Tax=Romboutsia sp. TaxID=1965302 RepID=UPI003F3567C0
MKVLKVLLIILAVGMFVTGCGSNVLDEGYDEEKLKLEANDVLSMLCDERYDDISKHMSYKLASVMPADKLKNAWEPIKKDFGDFEEVTKLDVSGNEDLATVILTAKFSNREGKFTITYNKEMMVEGIYIK